jgi:pyridoxal 5'-phosphate synthase pdxS subunit
VGLITERAPRKSAQGRARQRAEAREASHHRSLPPKPHAVLEQIFHILYFGLGFGNGFAVAGGKRMDTVMWSERQSAEWKTKVGLAVMLKGGVIMDVVTAEQAKIAERSGAAAVMALERVPADIRAKGGVARMSDPKMIKEIQSAVSIPVMAKCRIGHFMEARILEALEVDFIDESEVLTPADDRFHVAKQAFKVPFVCGCRDLGEALRRIGEGAAMIRTKGEPGTGDIVEAVRHIRSVNDEIARLSRLREEELMTAAKELGAPYDIVVEVARPGKLPVPNFSAGGVATPADAALMMALGAEAVFVGSGIFKSGDPERRARAIVGAVTYYKDPAKLAELSEDLGEPMVGIGLGELPDSERMAKRGW